MDIIESIERARYLASEQDVEALARDKQANNDRDARISGAYLRVLVALTAQAIGGKTAHLSRRRGKLAKALHAHETEAHKAALEGVAARCYAAVMRAVVTDAIAHNERLSREEQSRRAIERNRRTNYARSALATLRGFVAAGRDIRDLDPLTVTKAAVREQTMAHGSPDATADTARLMRSAERAARRITREAEALAAVDPSQAEALLTALIDSMQLVLQRVHAGELGLPTDAGTTTIIQRGIRERAAARP